MKAIAFIAAIIIIATIFVQEFAGGASGIVEAGNARTEASLYYE